MKPEKYPLPWCDCYDIPYWQVNMHLILHAPGWQEWQSHKPMAEIIPKIDELIENCNRHRS